MNDDFLLDEDEFDEQDYYIDPTSEDSEDDSDEDSDSGFDGEVEISNKIDKSLYEGKMTKDEIWMSSAYDNIVTASRSKDGGIEDAVTIVVMANPKHTSTSTVGNVIKDLFHKQGKSRMVNSLYTPEMPMRGEDVDEDLETGDDTGLNKEYSNQARNQIARFIEYLASRDLSKDSVISRRRKQRHIPAFIIFLFSSGLYDFILNCPTMPEEYDKQINLAMKKILKAKYDIVEQLANRYDQLGRTKIAERVRKMQLSWFNKEPAEIMVSSDYKDLGLTYDDVLVYKEFRSKFTNTSKAITQDVISELIEVVVDKDAGIYERLKDKTRSDAISDVKQVFKNWSKDNPVDSELADRIIWNNGLTN